MDKLTTLRTADINVSNGVRFIPADGTGSGPAPNYYFISGNGDLNGDGINDVAINVSGRVQFVYGQTGGLPGGEFDLNTLDGTDGFEARALSDQLTRGVRFIGDINDDGIDDVMMSANAQSFTGAVFVLLAQPRGSLPILKSTPWTEPTGFASMV